MARRTASTATKPAAATREALVTAAIATLQEDGFAGASARVIAERAHCNQALIFYHYGSVVQLLLAALDAVSARRMTRYRSALAGVANPADLLRVAAEIFREDMERGDITVLAEMIAGTSSTPGLREEVAARIEPWHAFARDAIGRGLGTTGLGSIVPLDDAAHAVVALYLGLEMLGHLDRDRSRGDALFEHANRLASLFGAVAKETP